MVEFAVNPHRLDPYKNFKFQVVLDGKVVPGVTRVSTLRRRTETIFHRDGTFPSHLMTAPGATSFDPIILERGITHDTTFEDWAALAYSPASDAAMSLRNFRKDMRINLVKTALTGFRGTEAQLELSNRYQGLTLEKSTNHVYRRIRLDLDEISYNVSVPLDELSVARVLTFKNAENYRLKIQQRKMIIVIIHHQVNLRKNNYGR